jgi:regulator of replication initiation timing
MPELIFDTQDAVPEPIRNIAVEKDGKWSANVVPKTELDEFRNRNVELSRERDKATSIFGRLTPLGFDPEKLDDFVTGYEDMRATKQLVDDGKLVADSSLAEAVEAKTGEMKKGFEGQIGGLQNENGALKGENEKLKDRLNRSIIDQQVMTAINDPKIGALPEATKQILREAHDVFAVGENEALIAKDAHGNVIYGTDGATPITPAEWLKKLAEVSPFFFKSSQGGGAGGGQGPTGGPLSAAQIAAMSPEEKMNYGREHGMNKG